jgi:HEPN domain-containing protein
MDADEKVKYWLDLAEYDIEIAESLNKLKKYLYVGFFCHLIIEKTIKAYFWFKVKYDPPYTHNLQLLASKSGLSDLMSEVNINFLNKLMPLNIEGRYPSDKELLMKRLDEKTVNEILNNTIELQKWIKALIKY